MKKKTAILIGIGLLFIAGNILLTLHNDSQVSRTSFITKWIEATPENLTKTLQTAGVVIPAEEHPLYFNPEQGGFKEFLVKKGDPVTVGTALYEYTSGRIDEDRRRLESERSELAREVVFIDEQIQQLEYLQTVSVSAGDTSYPVSGSGLSTTMPGLNSDTIVEVTIAKEIYEKELEKSRVLTEIAEYEDSLRSLDTDLELDISSEVSGTVKEINYDLQNPIMKIISDVPKVKGTLTEAELQQVKEGMKVYVSSELLGKKVGGRLTKIANHPENEPDVTKESQFPFEIELDLDELSSDGSESEIAGSGSDGDESKLDGEFDGAETESDNEEIGIDGAETESDNEETGIDGAETEFGATESDGSDETGYNPDEPELNGDETKGAELIHGSHIGITVVLDEVFNAITVSEQQIKKGSYLYVLVPGGKIERREIGLGLEVGGRIQIEKGLEKGETFVAKPDQVIGDTVAFITKLDTLRISPAPFKKEKWIDIFKEIGIGFSKR